MTGMGIVSPAGVGIEATLRALREHVSCLGPISLFEVPEPRLPVGQVNDSIEDEPAPRSHNLALTAARQALSGGQAPPDAIVLGCTTGGITTTEELLRAGVDDPERFRFHATGSVAAWLAEKLGCGGPAITVSTACSSGAVALKTALEMLRQGRARRVLAGGVDALCRLTYHGFRMLKVVDPSGARPLDRDREGMTVGEAAAMLMLTWADSPPSDAIAVFSGGGLSCDAHHPSAPHPDGEGAVRAMRTALEDAGLSPDRVDYINLHGTATRDNDASESRAIRTIYPESQPPLSSTKGIFGHSLAASGAVEAVVSILAIREGFVPANVGCETVDPELGLSPVLHGASAAPRVVLSNSFGFGGNNASLVFTATGTDSGDGRDVPGNHAGGTEKGGGVIRVLGCACATGAGMTEETFAAFGDRKSAAGILAEDRLTAGLPPRRIRRLRRLPKLALGLAVSAIRDAGQSTSPFGVYVGTGWGPLSETHAFLHKLTATGDKLSSPTDFVGSIHNAVSSQLAMEFGAKGPNVTTTNGDNSFQQALFSASWMERTEPFLLCGVDEAHESLSPLLDPSVAAAGIRADGGGALVCEPSRDGAVGPSLRPIFFSRMPDSPTDFLQALGGQRLGDRFAAIFAGVPVAHREAAGQFLDDLVGLTGFSGPVIPYRDLLGEFATVSAVAAVMAVQIVRRGSLPAGLSGTGRDVPLQGKGILLLDLGSSLSAIEVLG